MISNHLDLHFGLKEAVDIHWWRSCWPPLYKKKLYVFIESIFDLFLWKWKSFIKSFYLFCPMTVLLLLWCCFSCLTHNLSCCISLSKLVKIKTTKANKLKSLKVAKWRKDEWRMMNDDEGWWRMMKVEGWMMKDDDFKLLRGFCDWLTDGQTNERTDICECRVAFATEKQLKYD